MTEKDLLEDLDGARGPEGARGAARWEAAETGAIEKADREEAERTENE